jgi:hydrogenase expression/formation protein HypC
MCLGIPGEVVEIAEPESPDALLQGVVSFGGVRKAVCLAYVPEARPGDHVIVHAGFALTVVDPDEAARIFELLGQIEAIEDPSPGAASPSHEVPG